MQVRLGRMKRRLPVILLLALVLFGGGYLIDRSRAASEDQLTGFFENLPTQLSSRVGGRVAKILVNEGDTVRAGQPLLQLEAETNEAALAAQRHQAEGARQQFLETKRGNRVEDIDRQREVVRELEASF